jgi:hypothetical protein
MFLLVAAVAVVERVVVVALVVIYQVLVFQSYQVKHIL